MNAAIKFVQGGTIGTAGIALIGVLSTPVIASNGNDAALGTVRWRWTVIDAPPGSAVPVGLRSDSSTKKTLEFIPDVRGGYLIEVVAFDLVGNQYVDQRVFQVAESNGFLVPPFRAKGDALNFSGSLDRGWSPIMEKYFRESVEFPTLATGGMFAASSASQLVQVPNAGNGRTLTVQGGFPVWVDPANPATLSLTGWWRANYGGTPWLGTPSLGTSATNPLAAPSGGATPTIGLPLNGLVGADFDGSVDNFVAGASATTFFAVGGGTASILFNADSAAAPGAIGSNACMFSDTGVFVGLEFTTSGLRAFTWPGAYQSVTIACAINGWHLVQMKWNGSTLRLRVDSGSWSSTASGNISSLANGFRFGMNGSQTKFFDGIMQEIIVTNTALADATMDDIKAYTNARYGLSL